MSLCKIASVGAAARSTLRAKMGNKALNSVHKSLVGSIFKRCSSCTSVYNCRKYGHQLPTSCVMTPFDPLPCFPTAIFRCTSGEVIGPGANKCGEYKNPEYFSYHHMTFYDIHFLLKYFRQPSADLKRKPS